MAFQIGHQIVEDLAKKMVQDGLLTQAQLTVARVSQKNLGEDLGQILIKKGFVTKEILLTFVGRFFSIPYTALQGEQVEKALIRKVPLHLARHYHAIPLRRDGEGVLVAMSNPFDRFALDDLRTQLRSEIKPVLSSVEEIDLFIERNYDLPTQEREKTGEDIEVIRFSHEEAAEASGEKLEKIATGTQIIQTVNQIIVQAYEAKASDIHLEPSADSVRVRFRIDGLLEEKQRLPRELLLPVVSRIKILGGLDIAERRIPQDGRVQLRIGGKALDLRVSTYPTLYGEKVVMRLLSKATVRGVDALGFSEKDRKTFSELMSKSHGIFLTTGPTGAGKSTTLYAALSRINSSDKNIISIEDPVESEISGVNQAQVNTKAGVTFASALRSILRQDPDVIMIGEIRDGETAEIAVRSAITGHLVLSTLHTNSAAGAISRLMDLGVEPFLLSSAIIGVLAQRLVRKICPDCREEVVPDPIRLGPLAPQIQKCFHGRGCPKCRMSGYSGRLGIFELAPTGEAIRKMISEKATDHEIEAEFRRLGVRSILDDGIDKINQGITSVDEVLRVTQEE